MVLLNLTDNSFTFNEVNLHACPNATLFLNSSYPAFIRSFENLFKKSANDPSSVAFCQNVRGGTMTRFGGVRSLLVISSV